MNDSSLNFAALTFDNADPLWFWALLAIAALALIAYTYRSIYKRSGRKLTWLLFGLRTFGVFAVMLALIKPAWTLTTSSTLQPKLALIVDNSQSMSILHAAPGSQDYTARYKRLLKFLDSPQGKNLRQAFDITALDINGAPLDMNNLPSEPTSEQTDLVQSLSAASARLRGQNAAGVVLISDGKDTTGRDNFLSLQEYPLPVHTIGFQQSASTSQQFDLAVLSVDCPQRTLVHNTVTVKIALSKDGGPAMELPIQIERAGNVLMAQKTTLTQGAAQQVVTLSYTPTQPGDFVLTARMPDQPGERTASNNFKLFKLRVDADPIRVLYVEGFLRPEFTFLRERLTSDPDIDLATFVRTGNPENPTAANIVEKELLSPERLAKINVIILGDVESSMLDETSCKAILEFLDKGGAVIVLGGYNNLGPSGLATTPLAAALPVEIGTTTGIQLEEPFNFKLTEEGKRHPALSITGDPTKDAAAWDSLPQLKGIVTTGNAKPGATVLARHPRSPVTAGMGGTGAGSDLGFVVLASQPYGKGTMLMLTADTTWRWSRIPRLMQRPDTLYTRFWSQMIRWMARRDVQSQRQAVEVVTDAVSYERGARVTIRVAQNPAALPTTSNDADKKTGGSAAVSLALSVATPDGRTVSLTPQPGSDPNLSTATYFPDRGGRFRIDAKLQTTTQNVDLANNTAEFLVTGSSLELDDPATNTALLEQIAQSTGGSSHLIDDSQSLDALVTQLHSEPRVVTQTQHSALWNNPAMLFVFVGTLSVEWFLRRRNKLV